jgi:hypothetical protein
MTVIGKHGVDGMMLSIEARRHGCRWRAIDHDARLGGWT